MEQPDPQNLTGARGRRGRVLDPVVAAHVDGASVLGEVEVARSVYGVREDLVDPDQLRAALGREAYERGERPSGSQAGPVGTLPG